MVNEEIAKKCELLRDLYLIQENWTKDRLDFSVDIYDTFKFLKSAIDCINEFIPMLEREVPDWAKNRAFTSRNRIDGFIVWNEKRF